MSIERSAVSDWAFTTDPDALIRTVTTEHDNRTSVHTESELKYEPGLRLNPGSSVITGGLGASTQDRGGHWYAVGTDLGHNQGMVFVCRPSAADPVWRIGAHPAPVTAAAAVGDGRLATGHRLGGLRIWSVAPSQVPASQPNIFPAMACEAAPDGSWFAIADSNRTVHVLARDSGRELLHQRTALRRVTAPALVPVKQVVWPGTGCRRVQWRVTRGWRRLSHSHTKVTACAFGGENLDQLFITTPQETWVTGCVDASKGNLVNMNGKSVAPPDNPI